MAPWDQKPPEYITGKATFCGREFFVSPDVLIPRVETEEIIRHCEEHATKQSFFIADVGTGCGCIGITLAKKFPNSTVYLSDISEGALKIARKNSCQEIIIQSDLLENYPKTLFDVIVANLPYIPTKRIKKLSGSVKDFEPHLALDGGPDGTLLINRLLKQLPAHLKPGGLAILEIDDTHTLKSFRIPPSFKAQIRKDRFGRNRFLVLRLNEN
jgi:release factor glutamine methyltransferase